MVAEPEEWTGDNLTADDFVTVTQEEYDKLRSAGILLAALQTAGVEGWDGYDIAVDLFNKAMGFE